MAIAKIRLEVNSAGAGRIWIDEHELSHAVTRVDIHADPNGESSILLHVFGDLAADVEAAITTRDEPANPAAPLEGRVRHR